MTFLKNILTNIKEYEKKKKKNKDVTHFIISTIINSSIYFLYSSDLWFLNAIIFILFFALLINIFVRISYIVGTIAEKKYNYRIIKGHGDVWYVKFTSYLLGIPISIYITKPKEFGKREFDSIESAESAAKELDNETNKSIGTYFEKDNTVSTLDL